MVQSCALNLENEVFAVEHESSTTGHVAILPSEGYGKILCAPMVYLGNTCTCEVTLDRTCTQGEVMDCACLSACFMSVLHARQS